MVGDASLGGTWRGAAAGAVWALPSIAVNPGWYVLMGPIAAVAGAMLGAIAAIPAGIAVSVGTTRTRAAAVGAASAGALWAAIAITVCLRNDVSVEGALHYVTLGPAAVGAAFGARNAVALHDSVRGARCTATHAHPPAARPAPMPEADDGGPVRAAAGAAVVAVLVIATVVAASATDPIREPAPDRAPAACQERSGGDNNCPGG